MEKEMLCPKCGKKMSLVAAGYYCMKDDYIIDPATGKPPIKPECAGYLLGERKAVNVFLDQDHLIIRDRDSSNILYDISLKDVDELEIGEAKLSAADAAAVLLFGVFAMPQNVGPTLKVTYISKTQVKNNVTLVTGSAANLANKIDSLRGVAHERKAGPVLSVSSTPHTPIPDDTRNLRRFCRYCGGENRNDAIFCEKCGKRIG